MESHSGATESKVARLNSAAWRKQLEQALKVGTAGRCSVRVALRGGQGRKKKNCGPVPRTPGARNMI